MQNLHQPATDPFTASTPYPPSQGVLVSVGVEPVAHTQPQSVVAASSTSDGVQPLTFRHLNTKTWAARSHHRILNEPRLLEWYGVELGNMHLSSGISRMRREREPHVQWFTQTYLVKSAGVEKVLDHSFFMRLPFESSRGKLEADAASSHAIANTTTSTTPHYSSASPFNSNTTTSCLTFQSAVTANLIPSTPVTPLSPDLVGPKSNLLAGSVQLGYEHWRGLNVMLFGASDGLVAGGSIFKKFKHTKSTPQLPSSAAASRSPFTFVRSLLPFRLHVEDTSLGAEYAWAQELKDYTAAFGFQSRFKIASKTEEVLTKPTYVAPLCSFATSMQFYGHIVSTFYAAITPRLTFASRFHAQLVNQESRLDVAWAYRLNPRHRVMTAIDSPGGVRLGVEWKASHQSNLNSASLNGSTLSTSGIGASTHFNVSSFLSKFLSHLTCRVFVQSYPLLPALLPSWNLAGSDVNGATYDPIQLQRLNQPQFSFGLSVEYED